MSNEFPTFDIDLSAARPEYIALVLSQRRVWQELALGSQGMGSRRERLQTEDFLGFEVDLPPLADQAFIVTAAQTVERAVAAHETHSVQALTALRALREELLFTEGEWEELPESWCAQRLSDIADIRSGITKGRKARGELAEAPFIRAANVQDGFLDLSEVKTLPVTADERARFQLQPQDILMTEGGNA